MNKGLGKWIKRLGTLITILSLVFIIKAATSLECDFSVLKDNKAVAGISVVGSIVMSMTVYIIAYGWKLVLTVLAKQKVNYKDACKIYAKANMGKYLPGNVMHYVERNIFAQNLGLNQQAVLLSTITEIFGLVCISFLIGIILEGKQLLELLKHLISYQYIVLFSLLFIVLLILLFLFRKKITKIIESINWKDFSKAFLKAGPTYFFFVMFGGIVMALLFSATIPEGMSFEILCRILASYAIAWVVGFLIPGSPGGIGVREFVLLFLLGDVLPNDILLTNMVIHRFVSIIGDALAYGSSVLLKSKNDELQSS